MIDLYAYVEQCKEAGLTASEAMTELTKAQAEAEEEFFEEYYNRPDVQYGWHQQDIIDRYRMER